MVYDFVITLKRPAYRLIDQVSQLMYVFSIIAFSYFLYIYQREGIAYSIVIAAMVISWVVTLKKRNNKGLAFFRLGLLFAAVGWVIGPEKNGWMALLYAVAAILEKQVKFPQEIGFSTKEIAFNSFPKKRIQWDDVQNVVLKDGLITLDHSNNTLVQKEVDEDVTPEVEKEFNEFCRKQLIQNAGNRLP